MVMFQNDGLIHISLMTCIFKISILLYEVGILMAGFCIGIRLFGPSLLKVLCCLL